MYQKTTLKNGLRLVTSSMPHARSVSIGFFIGIGSRHELPQVAGVSHVIEHMCFKGTERRPTPSQISGAIEGVGGILNAGTDKELTVYWCKVAQPHFLIALDVLVDMLLNSRFDPGELEKERQVIIEEIRMTKDSPAQEVSLIIDELLWPDHPLGVDTAGTLETVGGLSRTQIMDYMRAAYLPSNTVLSIAGAVDHENALDVIEQAIGNWSGPTKRPPYTAFVEGKNPRLKIEKRDTEQAHLCLALPGLSLNDPRRFILDLLNVVLGEGMSSRLFTEIRENRGLAYNIYSYIDHFLDCGALTVSAGVEPRNLKVTVTAVMEQLARLKSDLVDEAEMNKAKELSKGRVLLRMEDSRNVSGWVGGQEVLTGKVITVDDAIAIIDRITAEELRTMARQLFASERLRLAVVGPLSPDEPLGDLLKL